MAGLVIDSVLFDKYDHFAGLELRNAKSGQIKTISPLDTNDSSLKKIKNSEALIAGNSHTRLIGFRTSKRCHSSKSILSVQPIYYSIDEEFCNSVFTPLSMGMLAEIGSYGPECAEDMR